MNTITLYDTPIHLHDVWQERSQTFDRMVNDGYTINISWGPKRIHVTCVVAEEDMVEFKLKYL